MSPALSSAVPVGCHSVARFAGPPSPFSPLASRLPAIVVVLPAFRSDSTLSDELDTYTWPWKAEMPSGRTRLPPLPVGKVYGRAVSVPVAGAAAGAPVAPLTAGAVVEAVATSVPAAPSARTAAATIRVRGCLQPRPGSLSGV